MTDEKWVEVSEFYQKEFPADMLFSDISIKLDRMNNHPDIQILRKMFCDSMITVATEGYLQYNDKIMVEDDNSLLQLIFDNVEKIGKENAFYWAFYYYMKKQYVKCNEFMREVFQNEQKSSVAPLDETAILDLFLVPFKNAPEEVWDCIMEEVRKIDTVKGIPEFCDLMSLYYRSVNDDEVIDALLSFMQKYPDYKTPNEMLGYTYYNMSMWNNAIACFEKVEEQYYFYMADIYWMLAWSSGKIKNTTDEEMYYRKSLELDSNREFTLNNLGYCLYKQKRYREALEIFEKCLQEKKDLSCAGNNFVRVLIALGRNADAKKFIRDGKVKVSKTLKDRVAKLDNHNARLKKDVILEPRDLDDEKSIEKVTLDVGVKRQQFSNEKLLEDELTARIESGMPVFGMNLTIYKRKGEYGRQYIIPVGRLDLLCEDKGGNLYVIELKKDSGYDDAYQQTAEYLDWFEHSEKFKGKKIYGIICLNSPTQQLIDKVHGDKRMRLFEYQISYTER